MNEKAIVMEVMMGFKRAGKVMCSSNVNVDVAVDYTSVFNNNILCVRGTGTDIILSYYAKDVARWLKEEGAQ